MFAIGVAIRMFPLYWMPYPFNPDGFVFAAKVRDALTRGRVSDRAMAEWTTTVRLRVTAGGSYSADGLTALPLAQPAIVFIGLEVLSYQETITEAEFSAATFASTTITEP